MTEAISLEALGLSQEALAERLVDKLVEGLMSSLDYDEDGYQFRGESPFANQLNRMVKDRVNSLVEELGNKHILPRVNEMVEGLVLQQTNQWGEKVGKPVTFIEYLTQRAENYMTEKVDFEGKSQGESSGYSWKGTQSRVSHMIHKHLHYSIETAMKSAMQGVTSNIAKGLEDTVRIKLKEAADSLKVTAAIKQ